MTRRPYIHIVPVLYVIVLVFKRYFSFIVDPLYTFMLVCIHYVNVTSHIYSMLSFPLDFCSLDCHILLCVCVCVPAPVGQLWLRSLGHGSWPIRDEPLPISCPRMACIPQQSDQGCQRNCTESSLSYFHRSLFEKNKKTRQPDTYIQMIVTTLLMMKWHSL